MENYREKMKKMAKIEPKMAKIGNFCRFLDIFSNLITFRKIFPQTTLNINPFK